MPTKTKVLDYGNFVHSPELPVDPTFSEYLDFVDDLLEQTRRAEEEWNRSPSSPELKKQKEALDEVLSDLVASLRDRYTIKTVTQDPTFLRVSHFFTEYCPISQPFSILHCTLGMPLHTALRFQSDRDLADINAALDEDTPFPWLQRGPHNRPCYLFGECVWELKPSEVQQTDEGIALLFLENSEKRRRDRSRDTYLRTTIPTSVDFIPEKVRVLVWRRTRGKCAVCGNREGLEFDYITPANQGGTATPQNIQLLCSRCYRRKNGAR